MRVDTENQCNLRVRCLRKRVPSSKSKLKIDQPFPLICQSCFAPNSLLEAVWKKSTVAAVSCWPCCDCNFDIFGGKGWKILKFKFGEGTFFHKHRNGISLPSWRWSHAGFVLLIFWTLLTIFDTRHVDFDSCVCVCWWWWGRLQWCVDAIRTRY